MPARAHRPSVDQAPSTTIQPLDVGLATMSNALVQDQLRGQQVDTGSETSLLDQLGTEPERLDGEVQSPEWFDQQKQYGRFKDVSKEMFLNEFIAKTLAYRDPTLEVGAKGGYSEYDHEMLAAWGYQVGSDDGELAHLKDEHTGLRATRFDALDPESDKHSIMAFRGTKDFGGMRSDVRAGIGRDQYVEDRSAIREMMARGAARSEDGMVDVTGHSLGGALASIATADNAQMVNALHTYQGAGVGFEERALFALNNLGHDNGGVDVHHYQVSTDIVHKAGDTQLPGMFHEAKIEQAGEGSLDSKLPSHTGFMAYDPSQDHSNTDRLINNGEDFYGSKLSWTHGTDDPSKTRHLAEMGRSLASIPGELLADFAGTGRRTVGNVKDAWADREQAGGLKTAGRMAGAVGEGALRLGGDVLWSAVNAPYKAIKAGIHGLGALGDGVTAAGEGVAKAGGWLGRKLGLGGKDD